MGTPGYSKNARLFTLVLLCLSPTTTALSQSFEPPPQETRMVPGAVYVRFVDGRMPSAVGATTGFASFDRLVRGLQVSSLEIAFPMVESIAAKQPASEATQWLRGVYRLTYDAPISPAAVVRKLARSPDVDMVEPQYMYRTTDLPGSMVHPNDARFSMQGYLTRLEVDDAWDTVKGESGDVVIAIVDEGLETAHPDLTANLWINPDEIAGNNLDDDNNGYIDDIHGWNFESDTPDVNPEEGDGHGTAVGGTANAVTDNSIGVAGSAWNAQTMAVNTGCENDPGYLCYPVTGVLYAIESGADVINCSWSGGHSTVLRIGIQSGLDSGALVVAAAGNSGNNIDIYAEFPARYPEVLSVGATRNESDALTTWTNYGRVVNVFAAGADVATTKIGATYEEADGTSFSSPLVAGIAALVMTERPGLEADQVREVIRLSADNIESANSSDYAGLMGNGRANADAALTATLQPAVRMVEIVVTDADGDRIGSPLETVTVDATFKNFGSAASNLTVGFDTSDPYIDWTTSSVSVGAVSYGWASDVSFSFVIAGNTPENYLTTLFTSITDGSFTDGPDAWPIILNYIPPFVTHETPSTKVSVANSGNIGHRGYAAGGAPSSGFSRNTSDGWDDLIFEGGLMLGTGVQQLMNSVTDDNADGQERDFVEKDGTDQVLTDPGSVGSQDGLVTLVESSESNAHLDLEVQVNSYTFDDSADDDYVILHYIVSNTGTTALTNMHVGLFLDFDINDSYTNDKLSFDSQRRTGYVESAETSGIAGGVRLLSHSGALHYAAIDTEDVVYDGFTDTEKWSYMSGGVGATELSGVDASLFIGAGPVSISPGSSVDVAFAVVHGGSAAELLSNSDAAQRKWNGIVGATLALSTDVTTLSENAGATTVTVTAATTDGSNLSSAESVTVTATGSGTAAAVDFGAVASFTIDIASGSSSGTGTFTLTPTNDAVDETDETITISSSNTLVSQNATITLTDDDATPAGIALAVSADTVDEGDGATTITLAAAVSGNTTFGTGQSLPIRVSGSGNSDAVDFGAVSDFSLVVPAESAAGTATFVLTPVDDQDEESDEVLTVRSTSSLVTNAPTIVITDNDDGSVAVALSSDVSTLSEGAGATTVTITAATTTGTALTSEAGVPISITGSGEESAVDFAAASELTVTIAAGETSGTGTFTLTPTDDNVDETDETITLVSAGTLTSQPIEITLTDDDDTPLGVVLSVDPDVVSEGDGATTITVLGTVDGGTTYGIAQTLPISVEPPQNSSAVDFAAVADFELTLDAATESSATTFELVPADDDEIEPDADITIQSASGLVTNAPVLRLLDDDGFGVELSLSQTSVSEGTTTTTISVTAATTDGNVLPAEETIPIAVTGSGVESAVDFTAVPAFSIVIAQGSSSGAGSFEISPVDDSVDELNESIAVSSTNTIVVRSVTLTLTDNDAPPTGIALVAYPDTVDEGAGATTIQVDGIVLGGTTYASAQTVPLVATASGLADAVDFAAVPGFDLVIGAEEVGSTASFTLVPEDDEEQETDEVVTLRSTHPAADSAPTITITDNDRRDILLSVSPTSVAEDAGPTTIAVTADVMRGTFSDVQTVPIAVVGSGTEAAVDFSPVSPIWLTIDANASRGTGSFTLTPMNDTVDELDERLVVVTNHPNARDSAFVTLIDDDAAPLGITLAATPSTAYEDDGPTQIAVTATVSGETLYADSQAVLITVEGSGVESAVDFDPVADFTVILPSAAEEGQHFFVLSPVDDLQGESGQRITISSVHPLVLNAAEVLLIDDDGGMTGTGGEVPVEIQVQASYPNPAAEEVTFVVVVPEYTPGISLRLYNVLGQQVATPFVGALQSGRHAVRFDASALPTGVYMYVIEAPALRHSGRFIVAR